MDFELSNIEYNGKSYITRDLDVTEVSDFYESVTVAEEGLWDAIESGVERGEAEETSIDNTIYFYTSHENIVNMTDEELIDYLIEETELED